VKIRLPDDDPPLRPQVNEDRHKGPARDEAGNPTAGYVRYDLRDTGHFVTRLARRHQELTRQRELGARAERSEIDRRKEKTLAVGRLVAHETARQNRTKADEEFKQWWADYRERFPNHDRDTVAEEAASEFGHVLSWAEKRMYRLKLY